eukprot:403350120
MESQNKHQWKQELNQILVQENKKPQALFDQQLQGSAINQIGKSASTPQHNDNLAANLRQGIDDEETALQLKLNVVFKECEIISSIRFLGLYYKHKIPSGDMRSIEEGIIASSQILRIFQN